jgi:hypothetical protein
MWSQINLMASLFASLHIRTENFRDVVEVLKSLVAVPAYISGPTNGWISAYPKITDRHQDDFLETIAQTLSSHLGAPVFASQLFEEEVFTYLLFDKGKLVDTYNSNPGYVHGKGTEPEGGNVNLLLPYCAPGATIDGLKKLLHDLVPPTLPSPDLPTTYGAALESVSSTGLYGQALSKTPQPEIQAEQLMIQIGKLLGIDKDHMDACYDLFRNDDFQLPNTTFIEDLDDVEIPVLLHSTTDPMEAQMFKELFESQGIEVWLIPDPAVHLSSLNPQAGEFRILVKAAQAPTAKRILNDYFEAQIEEAPPMEDPENASADGSTNSPSTDKPVICTQCRATLDPDSNFCDQCGEPVAPNK